MCILLYITITVDYCTVLTFCSWCEKDVFTLNISSEDEDTDEDEEEEDADADGDVHLSNS